MTIFRLIARGHTPEGESWNTGCHVSATAVTVDDALTAWTTAWGLLWNGVATPADSIKQLVKTTCGTDFLEADELSPATGKNLTQAIGTSTLVGTSTADELPGQIAPVLSLRTALANRAGRGRMFLPPVTIDASLATGLMDGTAQGQISTAGQKMVQSLNGAGFQVGVYHPASFEITDVVAVDVPNVFGTQRRRVHQLNHVRVRHSV